LIFGVSNFTSRILKKKAPLLMTGLSDNDRCLIEQISYTQL
jgi:hypothetical protein